MPLKGPEEMRREQRMIFVRVLVWVRMCAGWDGMEWNGTEEDMDARIGGDARRCAQP